MSGAATLDRVLPPDTRRRRCARMANVGVQPLDISPWAAALGAAVGAAIGAARWSHKEAAASIGVDPAELGKWLSGQRRPQFDRLFAVPALRAPLLVALAGLEPEVEVVTVIRLRHARPGGAA